MCEKLFFLLPAETVTFLLGELQGAGKTHEPDVVDLELELLLAEVLGHREQVREMLAL